MSSRAMRNSFFLVNISDEERPVVGPFFSLEDLDSYQDEEKLYGWMTVRRDALDTFLKKIAER